MRARCGSICRNRCRNRGPTARRHDPSIGIRRSSVNEIGADGARTVNLIESVQSAVYFPGIPRSGLMHDTALAPGRVSPFGTCGSIAARLQRRVARPSRRLNRIDVSRSPFGSPTEAMRSNAGFPWDTAHDKHRTPSDYADSARGRPHPSFRRDGSRARMAHRTVSPGRYQAPSLGKGGSRIGGRPGSRPL